MGTHVLRSEYGPEKVTNGTFLVDPVGDWGSYSSDWTWSNPGEYIEHNPGNTTALTQNISVVAGHTYLLNYTIQSMSTGTLTISCGGVTDTVRTSSAGYRFLFTAINTNSLTFTPDNDFDGHLMAIMCKEDLGSSLAFNRAIYSSVMETEVLTANRTYTLPDSDGTLATQEYVTALNTYHAAAVAAIFTYGNLAGTYSASGGGGNGTLTGLNNNAFNINYSDVVTLSINDRVLIAAQTDGTQDGIYSFTQDGDGATVPYVFTRVDDWKHGAIFYKGSGCGITSGTRFADTFWIANTSGTVGVTDPAFDQLAVSDYDLAAALNLKANLTGAAFTGVIGVTNTDVANIPYLTYEQAYDTTFLRTTGKKFTANGVGDNLGYTQERHTVTNNAAIFDPGKALEVDPTYGSSATAIGNHGIDDGIDWTIMGWFGGGANISRYNFIAWTDPAVANRVSGMCFNGMYGATIQLTGMANDGSNYYLQSTDTNKNVGCYDGYFPNYYHYAVAWNNTSKTFTFWINGVKQENLSAITSTPLITTMAADSFEIGNSWTDCFSRHDELGIYNAVLTNSEVAADYNYGHGRIKLISDDHIMHLWHFDTDANDSVISAGSIDLTLTGVHATLINRLGYNYNAIDTIRVEESPTKVTVDFGDPGADTRLRGQDISLVYNNDTYNFNPLSGSFDENITSPYLPLLGGEMLGNLDLNGYAMGDTSIPGNHYIFYSDQVMGSGGWLATDGMWCVKDPATGKPSIGMGISDFGGVTGAALVVMDSENNISAMLLTINDSTSTFDYTALELGCKDTGAEKMGGIILHDGYTAYNGVLTINNNMDGSQLTAGRLWKLPDASGKLVVSSNTDPTTIGAYQGGGVTPGGYITVTIGSTSYKVPAEVVVP